MAEIAHADDLDDVVAAIHAVNTQGAAEVEYRMRHARGHYVWVHVLLRARYDEQGQLIEVIGAARDISHQKHQQAQLLEATERFERAFDHAPIGMALVDLDGRG